MRNIEEITNGFELELNNIKEYIEFIEENIVVNTYKKYNFNNICEISENLEIITEQSNEKLNKLYLELSRINTDKLKSSFDFSYREGEIIDFICELFESNREITEEEILEEVINYIEKDYIEPGFELKELHNLYNNKNKCKEFVAKSIELYEKNRYQEIIEEMSALDNYRKSLKLIDTKKNINIYRQSFLQLVAIFDSTVFDIIRLKYNERFFEWIKLFKNESIKYHEIGNSKSFEDFKSNIIDKQIKGYYIKELLDIINNNSEYKSVFSINGEYKYREYREIISRRNAHIHNNGIVDDKYSTDYNIYSKNIGEYIEINKEYFDKAYTYIRALVEKIATM